MIGGHVSTVGSFITISIARNSAIGSSHVAIWLMFQDLSLSFLMVRWTSLTIGTRLRSSRCGGDYEMVHYSPPAKPALTKANLL